RARQLGQLEAQRSDDPDEVLPRPGSAGVDARPSAAAGIVWVADAFLRGQGRPGDTRSLHGWLSDRSGVPVLRAAYLYRERSGAVGARSTFSGSQPRGPAPRARDRALWTLCVSRR